MMVTRSAKPLSATIRLAWSAMAEHSIPYTCFAPDCRSNIIVKPGVLLEVEVCKGRYSNVEDAATDHVLHSANAV